MKAWWFSKGHTLPHGDGREIALGVTHKVDGPVELCRHGLHASVNILDALYHATGPIVWHVYCAGEVVTDTEKLVCSERTYISGGIDVSDTLQHFTRLCALDVVRRWNVPVVVVRFLRTGDAALRASAWAAARRLTGASDNDAAYAARAAGWATESDAVLAASYGTKNAAWATGWAAARAATKDVWDSGDAARAAASTAARAAARDAQNVRLEGMILSAIAKAKGRRHEQPENDRRANLQCH